MNISYDSEGLPVLPEGYFWRVTGVDTFGFWYVQLRKRMLIGSRVVKKTTLDSFVPITNYEIHQAAVMAYTDWVDPTYYDRLESQVFGTSDPTLIGDRP